MSPSHHPTAQPLFASPKHLDATICWLLESHPVSSTTLASIGWFDRNRKARKCLRRLAASNRISLIGTSWRGVGRPEFVFCRWQPAPEHLQREVELTEFFLRLHAGEIQRGPSVSDQAVRPDAEVWINGVLYYLELDRGAADVAQLVRRLRAYEDCPHPSLWLCATEERADDLRRRANILRSTALFAVLTDPLPNPHSEIWRDCSGSMVALPREP